MTRVLRINDVRARDVGLSGDVMATLARLAADGVRIPPGFVVTTECGALDDPEVEAAVFRGYDALGDGHGAVPVVSVRSSPTHEDRAAHSDAGLVTNVFDVLGLDDLFVAIDTCRRSATAERDRPYFRGQAEAHMAVGVLALGAPDLSGVTFTRCPLGTGRVVVETVRGPLAPLLDGSVIPEHLELLPERGAVVKRLAGEHGGGLLEDPLLALVRDTSLHISELLGGEVDVEWTLEAGQLTVVQARLAAASSAGVT